MRVLKDLLLLLMLVTSRVLTEETNDGKVESSSKWQVLYRVVKECASKSEPAACLKLKFLTFLDRACAIQEPLMLTDYVALVKDPDYQDEVRSGRSISQAELQNIFTQSPERKNEILDEMLSQRVDAFFNSRSIQMNLPVDDITGRSKKKKKKKLLKKLLPILAGVIGIKGLLGGLLGKFLMGKVALIAGKALLISKIALVLSIVILLKKLGTAGKGGGGKGGGGGGDDEEITAQVIYATPEHEHYSMDHHYHGGGGGGGGGGGDGGGGGGGGGDGGWWRRRNIQDAHDLVYSGYRSFNNTATSDNYRQK